MIVTAGATNVSVYYYIVQDASGTSPGEPVTGLLFSDIETGGAASYARQGAARVDLTLITLASASAAHSDGGFIEVDGTHMKGVYRCDYPDAAWVTGVDQAFLSIVVAAAKNAVAAPIMVDISDFDLRNTSAVEDGCAAALSFAGTAVAGDSMDILSISGDATAADNLELQYDGTGLTGDNFPSSQSQVSSIAAAPGVGARPFVPSTITVTAGTNPSGSADDMANDDTLLYTLDDNLGTLTLDLDYQLDAGISVVQYILTAAAQGNSDDLTLQIKNQVSTNYDTFDLLVGANGLSFAPFDKTIVSKYTTANGLFQVRITGTGLSSATLTINKAVAYGQSSASAIIPNGAAITLTASTVDKNLIGNNWTLALGGQDLSNAYVKGAEEVSGIATSPTGEAHFENCGIAAVTCGESHWEHCGFKSTLTVGIAGVYTINDCYSKVGGPTGWTLDMNSVVGATNVSIRDLKGSLTINNLTSDHTLTVGGTELGAIVLNGADATVEIRGIYKSLADNLTGTPAVNVDGAVLAADVAAILLLAGTDGVTLSAAQMNAIADHVVRRNSANARASSDGDTLNFRSLLGGVSKLTNKVGFVGTDLVTREEDDSSVFGTQAATTDAAAELVTDLDTT